MEEKKVFIINGMGGVGKDNFVSFVAEFVPTLHISIVEPVKEIAKTLGWTGSKTEVDRRFLYELKAALDHFNDSNYAYVRRVYEDFIAGRLDKDYRVLCIDMREEHQITRGRKEFGAKVVLVTREAVKNITSNAADANVFDIDYDIVVPNNGTTEELRAEAKEFVKKYVLA